MLGTRLTVLGDVAGDGHIEAVLGAFDLACLTVGDRVRCLVDDLFVRFIDVLSLRLVNLNRPWRGRAVEPDLKF